MIYAGTSVVDVRKTAPPIGSGVVRTFNFSDPSKLGGDYAANFGTIPGTSANPLIDPTVKYKGQSTLRFDIPSMSGANAGGNWFGNFSSDLKTQFGAGDHFSVEVVTMWNQALFDTVFMAENLVNGKPVPGTIQQAGTKLFDINFGDEPNNGLHHYSSAGGKLVVQTRYAAKMPILYAYDSHSNNAPFESPLPPYDFNLQNGMPSPFCLYSNARGKTGAIAGCFNIVPLKWMRWKLDVSLGPLGVDASGFPVWRNNHIQFFGAVEDAPYRQIFDWKPTTPGYFDWRACDDDKTKTLKIGKVWAFPYITAKDTTQKHDLCQAWYGPITISRLT